MKIFIVGLGLMGASYSQKLHELGHDVFGYDLNKDAVKKGQEEGFIAFDSDLSKLMVSDLIILCLYPKDNIAFILEHQHLFKKHALLTDISGVKMHVVESIESNLRHDIEYISHHPMAGRAKKGFDAKDKTMFHQSNVILVETKRGKQAHYELLTSLFQAMGFKRVITTSPKIHDEAIAYTSQLTHAIATSLMNGINEVMLGTTGDSFRELTRIANINEELWTDLFLENKEAFIKAIDDFQHQLEHLKNEVENGNVENIKSILKKGRVKRETFEKHS